MAKVNKNCAHFTALLGMPRISAKKFLSKWLICKSTRINYFPKSMMCKNVVVVGFFTRMHVPRTFALDRVE